MSTRHSVTQVSWPRVYLDEDVRAELRSVFGSWASEVWFARDVIGAGHPDEVVMDFASSEAAILVTANASHFLNLARRGKHRGLSLLVLLQCSAVHSRARVQAVHDLMNLELQRRAEAGAHGIVLELGGNWVKVHR